MTTNSPQPPAGWYPDPQGGAGERWWNGSSWSTQTRPAAPPAPPAAAPYGAATPGYGAPIPGYGAPAAGYGAPTAGYGAPSGYGAAGSYQPTGYPYTAPPIGAWRSPADDRPDVRGMGGAIRAVFTRYARFDGRASRSEFWYWTLFYTIVIFAAYALLIITTLGAAGFSYRSGYGMPVFGGLFLVLLWAWLLGTFVPTLAVQVRRLRDAGYHWGFIFLSLVPFGGIAVLVMSCMPSKYP